MTHAEETVQRLYESIKRGDAAAGTECYCDDARYRDLAFDLKGKTDIAAMWRLVCSRGVKIEYKDIRTEGSEVKGHWVFDYKFHGTNPVHNVMDSTFVFRDGKILVHHDHASRWKWAKQALGIPKGALVTVLPFILRSQARKELEEFRARKESADSVAEAARPVPSSHLSGRRCGPLPNGRRGSRRLLPWKATASPNSGIRRKVWRLANQHRPRQGGSNVQNVDSE